jgi:diphthamide synthase (EF-2-diphthine--ammonia ligase)
MKETDDIRTLLNLMNDSIAGLHVEGARILDRVREVMSMRMITSTGQRLRDEERERIFRKLTSIDAVTRSLSFDQIGWRFISGAISYSITYTKQQMSDFLKED